MKKDNHFDVIIIGGSYSGLAAGMALGRSLRKVLIIDGGQPCNRQTPYSHNFLTQDGKPPAEIAALGRNQVAQYHNVTLQSDMVTTAEKVKDGFSVETEDGHEYTSARLVFATGIRDILPDIEGLSSCWGISVLHCPYCHGYEVRAQKTAIIGNGDYGFEFSGLIANWTDDLTLFTNGVSTLSEIQKEKLQRANITIVEEEIVRLDHQNGQVRYIEMIGGVKWSVDAIYTHAGFEQHCSIPQELGCEMTEEGYLQVDSRQKTTVEGIYACGDNVTRMRTVANAVAMGTTAGMMLNKEMVLANF